MPRITEIESLMFPVELRPVYYMDTGIDGIQLQRNIPNSRVVVNKKSGKPFGVVSNSYQLVTNEKALEMGKRYCAYLFGADEAANIKVFKVDAPSTGSYCHIDLLHRDYFMNLWGTKAQPDIYVPYLRVTNSYNTSRALRFDIGFCRTVCLNGVIFTAQTIRLEYSHVKHELSHNIPIALEKETIANLVEDFKSHMNKLRNYHIPRAQAFDLLLGLFRIKDEGDIDFESEKESWAEYDALLRVLDWRLDQYIGELGENGYALFNVITDIASHAIEGNRYFRRREVHAMQRFVGDWIHSFSRELERPDFDIDSYLERLKKSQNSSSTSTQGGSTVQGHLF